jgi:hypothetical protein
MVYFCEAFRNSILACLEPSRSGGKSAAASGCPAAMSTEHPLYTGRIASSRKALCLHPANGKAALGCRGRAHRDLTRALPQGTSIYIALNLVMPARAKSEMRQA